MVEEIACPNCGSNKVHKKGMRVGKQRYKCPACGANFTEGKEYIAAKKKKPLKNIKCPYCGSIEIKRDGKLGKKRAQRYKCKSCNRGFSSITKLIIKLNKERKTDKKCPYCSTLLNFIGYNKSKSLKRYMCPSCFKTCTEDSEGNPVYRKKFNEVNKEIKCPNCGTYNLKKAGFSNGHRRYVCKECHRGFRETTLSKAYPLENKEKVIELILKGKSPKKVAKEYSYNLDYVRHLLLPYYKKESISEEQKAMIIKYGVMLKVPVDYLAEYVPCSERKCKEVIKEYKDKYIK